MTVAAHNNLLTDCHLIALPYNVYSSVLVIFLQLQYVYVK